MSVYNVRVEILKHKTSVRHWRRWDVSFVFPERGVTTCHGAGRHRRSVPHIQQVMISSNGGGPGLGFFRLSFIEECVSPGRLIINIAMFNTRSDRVW